MRSALIVAAAALAVVLTVPLLSGAEEDGQAPAPCRGEKGRCGPMAGPARAHKMLTEAGATEEQLEKLNELAYRMHLEAVDLEAAIKKAELEFHHLIAGDVLDEAKLHAGIDALAGARAAMAKHSATGFVSASRILGADLWKKVKSHVIRMHGFGPGFGHGPRHGMGPRGHGGRGGGGMHGPRPKGRGEGRGKGCDCSGQRPGREGCDCSDEKPRREGRGGRHGEGHGGRHGGPRDR